MTLKESFKTIIRFGVLFVVIWLAYGDMKTAAISSLLFAVILFVILNTKDIYLHLKMNRFNVKSITYLKNWKFYVISTVIIVLICVFIFDKVELIICGIFSLVVLGGLLIMDVVKSIFKF